MTALVDFHGDIFVINKLHVTILFTWCVTDIAGLQV